MLTVLSVAGILVVLLDFTALILWKSPGTKTLSDLVLPMVSILVPVRNEEKNIKRLIESLRRLDYPSDKLEILIGEDRSEDHTIQFLREEIGSDQRFKVVSIANDLPGLVAKANVIAQLIPHSRSSYFFITDADVSLPSSWIKTLLLNHTANTGVTGGTTVVRVHDLWSALQNYDWLFAQGLLFVAGGRFETLAVSGTNMMITRQACDAIGGYQNIPYSLTEDIGILTAAKKQGFTGKNVLSRNATATIEAQPDWSMLILQRARWTYGALRLPKSVVLLLLLRTFFLIYLLVVAWWTPVLAVLIYLSKIIINWIFITRVANCLDQKISFKHFIGYEVFSCLISTAGLLRYIYPANINWKGRKYR